MSDVCGFHSLATKKLGLEVNFTFYLALLLVNDAFGTILEARIFLFSRPVNS
jgi:hypothetical protein